MIPCPLYCYYFQCTIVMFNISWNCYFLQPARRSYAVSLNLLHNLHCSWSAIARIFFHLVVSTFCYCRLKIAPVFLASALHCNHLCSSSSTSFRSSLWILLYLKFCICFASSHLPGTFEISSIILPSCCIVFHLF